MIDDSITMATTIVGYNRRLSMVTILLASIAFLLVITSVAAFIYITRKEKILRKLHLISAVIIILVELAFLIAVVTCCITQSKSILGQILAAVLILISLLALMTLIYFLLEDVIKERIEPHTDHLSAYRSYEVQEIKSVSRHESPTPTAADDTTIPITIPTTADDTAIPITIPTIADDTAIPITIRTAADDTAIPIITPPVLTPLPRIPTPPAPIISPLTLERIITPPRTHDIFSFPQESAFVVDFDKIRRDLLAAIEERTIPALEEAIQQVKDHNCIQQLKYECERALELLNRLMKIEHMKIRILRLNQATIAELHSYTKPPEEVFTVMRATCLLLGHSEKEIHDWPQIQNLLGRLGKESVRRRCYELNPLDILYDKAHEAKDILRNYDLIRVSEISLGLAAFFSWAGTMIEEREKLLESQRQIVR